MLTAYDLFDVKLGRIKWLGAHPGLSCLCALPNRRVASGSSDGTVRVFNVYEVIKGGRLMDPPETPSRETSSRVTSQTLEGHTKGVYCLCALPGGKIASGSWDSTVKVWDLESGTHQTLNGHTGPVMCLGVFSDGRLVSGSGGFFDDHRKDNTVRVWDLGSGTHQTLKGHTDSVNCLCVLPDGRIASGSSDNTVRVWDLGSGDHETLKGHTGSVNYLCVLDGRIASGSRDRVTVWDLESWGHRTLGVDTGDVNCLCALPDGRIASGSWDGTVRVWDLKSGTRDLVGHTDSVNCLCVLQDGRLASGSDDKKVLVWDIDLLNDWNQMKKEFLSLRDRNDLAQKERRRNLILSMQNVKKKADFYGFDLPGYGNIFGCQEEYVPVPSYAEPRKKPKKLRL